MPAILLVEDNAADVELFRLALDSAGVRCELLVFDDGREVIDYVRTQNPESPRVIPDLIILDLNLPKVDGIEALQIIRGTPGFAQVPFAVLSSSSSIRERGALEALNIRDYIVKPADLDEYMKIGARVGKLLGEISGQNSYRAS